MEKVVIRDCTVYRGDCLEMLESIAPGSIDCVWTDPPFGISYVPNSRKVLEIPEMLANDDKPRLDFVPPIVKTVKNSGAIYLCTRFDVAPLWSNALTEAGPHLLDQGQHIQGRFAGSGQLRGNRPLRPYRTPSPSWQKGYERLDDSTT